jgi:hypothetical protein
MMTAEDTADSGVGRDVAVEVVVVLTEEVTLIHLLSTENHTGSNCILVRHWNFLTGMVRVEIAVDYVGGAGADSEGNSGNDLSRVDAGPVAAADCTTTAREGQGDTHSDKANLCDRETEASAVIVRTEGID